MKIKTITCHNVYNHGASLQEYALLKYLELEGHKASAINYTPPYLSNQFNMWEVNNSLFDKNLFLKILYIILKLPIRLLNIRRKVAFDKFSKLYITQTKVNYKSNEDLRRDIPEADAYICGSDQIWNSFFENGKDPAFYLDFVPENKLKISYAASFAINQLDENIKDFVKVNVSRLNHISVRESSGLKILREIGIENAVQVLDPVFLLDVSYWNNLNRKINIKKDYIFVYDFDSNDRIEELAKLLKKKYKCQIITVNKRISYADYTYFNEGPNMFISLIKNAKIIISNSFHAVAFSIIYEKSFFVFNRSEKINTRMQDLLTSLNLGYLLIDSGSDINQILKTNIDFNDVKSRLIVLIKNSKSFLSKALEYSID